VPVPLAAPARVSVVIPCYRYGRYLPEVVASALDQPGLDVDVLIVDDASPADSAAGARSLAARDPRVRVLVNDPNIGHIATYNRGIAEVTGEFVVLLSADDLLAPGAVTRAVALMQAHPRVGFVYGYAPEFEEQPPAQGRRPMLWTTWRGCDWLDVVCRRGRNLIFNPEVVMRREVMATLGAYDADLPHGADMELWMRAALHWDVGRVMGPHQGYYRQHGANMHLSMFGGVLDDLVGRKLVFDRVLDEVAVGVLPDDDRRRRRARAYRALAREAAELAVRAHDTGRPEAAALAADYLEFAEQTHPGMRASRLWRAAQRRTAGAGSWFAMAERGRVVRDKARWRVWRALGV
jgi:glycosyltransferase involved in cell wall biosynthesis